MWCRISFLGVWDTVVALGAPFPLIDFVIDLIPGNRHRFHDLRLACSVENAFHALAVDDEQKTFHPTLWDIDLAAYQSMKQVWFCGMHTDAGGGYREQGISDIALNWMVQMARQNGLEIYPKHKVAISPDIDGMMHDSSAWCYRRKVRSWPTETHGRPCVHESVLKRTANRYNENDPPYEPWILDGAYKCDVDGSNS